MSQKICLFFMILMASGCFLPVRAQTDDLPPNVAPPPVKVISKDEKFALDSEPDLKKRTKLSLMLMEARLKKAEELNSQESYGAMLNELGGFDALMHNTLRFLNRNNNGGGKVLDNYKRYEMGLREFTPRLEVLRRDAPSRYEYWLVQLLKSVREARTRAIDPFFSDTVVPDN